MAEKPTVVDTISAATRQNWRRIPVRKPDPLEPEKPRLGRWPPPRRAQWRLEMLKPWKRDD